MKQFFFTAIFVLLASSAWATDQQPLPPHNTDAVQAGGIDGVVRDKKGQAMPDAEIKLQDGQGAITGVTTSNANGLYSFTSVPAGSYVLLLTQKDAVLSSTTVSVSDHTIQHKDILFSDTQTMNVVIAPHLEARNDLSPKTGTTAYALNRQSIESMPQGADTSLNKVLLQAPGVAEDTAASGNLHIRGEHGNVQYRLNGILLPDGISGFGDTIDSHIVESATLLDGALPAQYGFRTAGVIDITTKSGFQDSGTASVMGGNNGIFQPSFTYGGTVGDADYFVAASHLSSNLGIENPTASTNAIHDHTEQNKQFGYASYMLDPMQRVELVAGNSISYYQIPNNPNQAVFQFTNPDGGSVSVANPLNLNSANLNERQFESNQYFSAAWQGGKDGVEIQIAPYIRNSELHYRPDTTGDLLFNGIASDVKDTDFVTGLQNDNSWKIDSEHTLRAGFTVQNDHIVTDSHSLAYRTDPATGNLLTDASGNGLVSASIINDHANDSQLYGFYLQDEWKITRDLTMNYGARFDQMQANVSANQLSPRLGFVYKATDTTVFHAGYARYFTPPPQELVTNADIGGFANTTNAPAMTRNDPVQPERSHNFDLGITQKIGRRWEIALDSYYKIVHDLLDEGQFGPALILSPFNYANGYIYGSELSATYTGEQLKAYGNLAFSRAMGENIVSGQFLFTNPAEFSYISNHYVHLDHDQTLTGSAGASYDVLKNTTVGIDSRFGSGLRNGFANTSHLPAYITFDANIEEKLDLFPHDQTSVRLSIINVMDRAYELRDGSGIGVGAPQWGARRGFFVALEQKF